MSCRNLHGGNETSHSNHGQLLQSPTDLLQILEEANLPIQDEIVHAFGYGSGVLSQNAVAAGGGGVPAGMVDVILVVEDAEQFHTANLHRNRSHYAGLMALSPSLCRRLQQHTLPSNPYFVNPGLFFHVTETLKYGVVTREDLLSDITNWSYLYLAGRLHKPSVTIVQDNEIAELHHTANLPAAFGASLLLSQQNETTTPCFTSAADLYTCIASLSYSGDPRMSFAEDPQKIHNLVYSPGQMERFEQLYRTSAEMLEKEGVLSICSNGYIWDSSNTSTLNHLWDRLPQQVRVKCNYTVTSNHHSARKALPGVLSSIVAPSARYQSIKGLWTAGLSKSAVYAYRKLAKGLLKR